MNIERLNQAINIMKRAGKVDMTDWQSGEIVETESEIHSCGTAACFAGWVAVSPEFQEAGGRPDREGAPVLPNCWTSGDVIAAWLETDNLKAVELLIYGEAWGADESFMEVLAKHSIPFCRTPNGHCIVLEDWEDYTAQDVIKYLNALKGLS